MNGLELKDENGNALTLDESGNGSFRDYLKNCIKDSAQSAMDASVDLSGYDWIIADGTTVTDIDFDGYRTFAGRMKPAMAFDSVDLSNPENSEFGTETEEALHFSSYAAENDTSGVGTADAQIIKMMNPMNYIGTDGAKVAGHWRIRHGAKDSDTAFPVPVMLALKLQNCGASVDFAIPWGQGHGGDYDLDELFAWIASII